MSGLIVKAIGGTQNLRLVFVGISQVMLDRPLLLERQPVRWHVAPKSDGGWPHASIFLFF
jgi:hypothetical protein